MYHRTSLTAGADAPAIVHVHGFGISGTYLEPTAALLTHRFRTFVPDLPGWVAACAATVRSICPASPRR